MSYITRFARFYFSPRGRVGRFAYNVYFLIPYAIYLLLLDLISPQYIRNYFDEALLLPVIDEDMRSYIQAAFLLPAIIVMSKRIRDFNGSIFGMLLALFNFTYLEAREPSLLAESVLVIIPLLLMTLPSRNKPIENEEKA